MNYVYKNIIGFILILLAVALLARSCEVRPAGADEVLIGEASWYSVASCKKEGSSGIMANGEKLNDEDYICATWDFDFGTRLLVTNLGNGKVVRVLVKDRGPAKRLVKKGRVIDLSQAAFERIADFDVGIIKVKVEVI